MMAQRMLMAAESRIITPGEIPGLKLWLDADDPQGNGSWFPDGSNVSIWIDKSASGLNASQATAAEQPVYRTGQLNSKPVIEFNGSSHSLRTANTLALGISGGGTMLAVARNTAASSVRRILSNRSTANSGYGFGMHTSNQGVFTSYGRKDYLTASTTFWGSEYQIALAAYHADFSVSFYKNGMFIENITYHSGMADSSAGIRIGAANTLADSAIGQEFWQGGIAEVLIYNRVLSTLERRQLERYLAIKWAISLG